LENNIEELKVLRKVHKEKPINLIMKNISTLSPKDAKHQISPLSFYLSLLFAESQNRFKFPITPISSPEISHFF